MFLRYHRSQRRQGLFLFFLNYFLGMQADAMPGLGLDYSKGVPGPAGRYSRIVPAILL